MDLQYQRDLLNRYLETDESEDEEQDYEEEEEE